MNSLELAYKSGQIEDSIILTIDEAERIRDILANLSSNIIEELGLCEGYINSFQLYDDLSELVGEIN